ncbi:hypothetical protein ACWEOI_12740 [Nocardia sp. NPDC004340]
MEVVDLAVDVREFGLDGLVGFGVWPLTALANEAFSAEFEFGKEYARLRVFGILAHRRLVSAG